MLAVTAAAVCFLILGPLAAATGIARAKQAGAAEEVGGLIDSALYTRAEFFGAQARVPFPFAEARNRIASLR